MGQSRLAKDIELLLKGVATNHTASIRDGWRRLHAAGPASIPEITAKLASVPWKDYPRGPQQKYLAVLLSLLHEIDADAARLEIKRLKSLRLHAMHQRTLSLIEARFDAKPEQHSIAGIPLTISKSISNREDVLRYLSKWIRTPPKADLQQITRIDVIPFTSELDYLGSYDLRSSGIFLTWPSQTGGPFLRWIKLLQTQHTLYHEVGHHALGYIEGGQDPEQEKEANDYGSRMVRRSRPILTVFVFLFLKPFRPLLKALSKWRRTRQARL